MKGHKKFFLVLFFSLVLISVDQVSKYLIRSAGGFYICNSALAFGIKIDPLVFYLGWILAILFILYKIFNSNDLNLFRIWNLKFGYFLVLSGALSNIIDRLKYGCVIDFINLKFWPVFNLADALIVVGAILILYSYFFQKVE